MVTVAGSLLSLVLRSMTAAGPVVGISNGIPRKSARPRGKPLSEFWAPCPLHPAGSPSSSWSSNSRFATASRGIGVKPAKAAADVTRSRMADKNRSRIFMGQIAG